MKADVLALVQTLAGGHADATQVERLYREIVQDFGYHEWLVQASLVTLGAAPTDTAWPTGAVQLLSVLYGNRELYRASLEELAVLDPLWRDRLGRPRAWTTELEPSQTFRLAPYPDLASDPFIFIHGAPFGEDAPLYAAAVIHTETRDDVLAWMELPLALKILAREFLRDSDHRDPLYAEAAESLADALLGVVG